MEKSISTLALNGKALFMMAALSVPVLAQVKATEHQAVSGTFAHSLPLRVEHAMTGSDFLRRTANLNPDLRENLIYREIASGNIPDRLRFLRAIKIDGRVQGVAVRLVVYVLPDYIAIGSNEDNVLMPMNFYTAARLAKRFGFTLPTTKLVDEIFRQSELKIDPVNLKPSRSMASSHYYGAHAQIVANLERAKGFDVSSTSPILIAGHKKDLVLSRKLIRKPSSLAIYGWHNSKGEPIQPVSTVHAANYADYSHGVRFVAETAYLNGHPMSIYSLLADPHYAALLSNEGSIKGLTRHIDFFAEQQGRNYAFKD